MTPDSSRVQLGLPDDIEFLRLEVSAPAQCLVVIGEIRGAPVRSHRMFVRPFHGKTYRQVAWPEGCNCFGSCALSPRAPLLYVLGESWRDYPCLKELREASYRGGEAIGLYRVDLPDGEASLIHGGRNDEASEGGELPWFVAELLGFNVEGDRLLAKVATGVRCSDTTHWDYSLVALDPHTGARAKLADLPAVFA